MKIVAVSISGLARFELLVVGTRLHFVTAAQIDQRLLGLGSSSRFMKRLASSASRRILVMVIEVCTSLIAAIGQNPLAAKLAP
ncbi:MULTISPECIES: hypothetical protein [unclassified Mesorhizobium]|uniref:hypothetical protein n=1 Tax=unclassified Mesorhizobium TaxID=325217 RepID=UPI00333CFA57